MAGVKQLAGQALWYGISNIAARFLNYLLTPILTYLMADAAGVHDYGGYSLLYAWIAVANIIFTYGFETGYFRFSIKEGIDRDSLFQTAFGSIVISTFVLILAISPFSGSINSFLNLDGHPEYIIWGLFLIGLDALSAIPFAKLRQENRPKKYVFVKLSGIVVNIVFTLFLLVALPRYAANHPDGALVQWFVMNNRIGLLLLANILQNMVVFLLLFPEWKNFRFNLNIALWKQLFNYSAPMIFIGLAGMINEVIDRQMLASLIPSDFEAQSTVGIYSANYKLAIFITLFIQAFKMAAEPFFFNQSTDKNAPALYARVMKWFVITLALAFLFSALYLDIWQYMIGVSYRSGLGIVPILLGANICLGIYYNLSIWYKLTDRLRVGLYISLLGTAITLIGNYFLIPYYGMYAAAWTTLVCYATMMSVAYFMGQRHYYIPYPVKRIAVYLSVMLICFAIKSCVNSVSGSWNTTLQLVLRLPAAIVLTVLYLLLILKLERNELTNIRLLAQWLKRPLENRLGG